MNGNISRAGELWHLQVFGMTCQKAHVKTCLDEAGDKTPSDIASGACHENFVWTNHETCYEDIGKVMEPASKSLSKNQSKLLLMAYNQQELKHLGQIVANPGKRKIENIFDDYSAGFHRALGRIARFSSHINVLMHGLGFFSKKISAAEKRHFLDVLEDYRAARSPLSQPVGILQSLMVRFDEPYLKQQTYYRPYPKELVEITDSGKGRGT